MNKLIFIFKVQIKIQMQVKCFPIGCGISKEKQWNPNGYSSRAFIPSIKCWTHPSHRSIFHKMIRLNGTIISHSHASLISPTAYSIDAFVVRCSLHGKRRTSFAGASVPLSRKSSLPPSPPIRTRAPSKIVDSPLSLCPNYQR